MRWSASTPIPIPLRGSTASPGRGRVNHYYFDLNRDWAFLTQVESRARIAAYLATPPQVHVDYHEMGPLLILLFLSPEFPVNANLPADVVTWAKSFAKANASAFDKFGWSYYTRENFDLFYPGYGDSWPTFQGAIGMTYEQAGHSTAGLALKRDDEQILTLRDRVWHHFTTAFATCETAARNRKELLSRFLQWHRSAIAEGEDGVVREYLIKEGDEPGRAAALAGLLVAQGIQVFRASEAFVAGPLRDFDGKEVDRESFPAGTYLVPLAQPRKRLANALLEPASQMRDLYFYDVSAWSFPAPSASPHTNYTRRRGCSAPLRRLPARGKGLGRGSQECGLVPRRLEASEMRRSSSRPSSKTVRASRLPPKSSASAEDLGPRHGDHPGAQQW